jgi:DNA modification methylase
MTIPIKTIWLPRPATKYPGCYPLGFENMLHDILKTEDYIHLFAGKAKTGFRVDINKEVTPNLVADVHDLSMIEDNKFYGAMADPPYTKEFAKNLYNTDYPKWSIWTKEMARVVKPNGLIGVMHNYVVPKIIGCQFEKIIVILTRIKQYPKIVTIQRKTEVTSRNSSHP